MLLEFHEKKKYFIYFFENMEIFQDMIGLIYCIFGWPKTNWGKKETPTNSYLRELSNYKQNHKLNDWLPMTWTSVTILMLKCLAILLLLIWWVLRHNRNDHYLHFHSLLLSQIYMLKLKMRYKSKQTSLLKLTKHTYFKGKFNPEN